MMLPSSIGLGVVVLLELAEPASSLPSLELLAVLAALLLLLLAGFAATRRAPAPVSTDELHGWEAFTRELDRSRRFGRSFTLIHVARTGDDLATPVRSLARLRECLRSIDQAWEAPSGLYVLLPETNRNAALALCARIRRLEPALMPDSVQAVSFPDDGITAGALLASIGAPAPAAPSAWSTLISSMMSTEHLSMQQTDLPPLEMSDDRQV